MQTIREIENRILDNATSNQRQMLLEDRNFGTRAAFWGTATAYGLATHDEYERARLHYRDIWNYRGD